MIPEPITIFRIVVPLVFFSNHGRLLTKFAWAFSASVPPFCQPGISPEPVIVNVPSVVSVATISESRMYSLNTSFSPLTSSGRVSSASESACTAISAAVFCCAKSEASAPPSPLAVSSASASVGMRPITRTTDIRLFSSLLPIGLTSFSLLFLFLHLLCERAPPRTRSSSGS